LNSGGARMYAHAHFCHAVGSDTVTGVSRAVPSHAWGGGVTTPRQVSDTVPFAGACKVIGRREEAETARGRR
jgi:hypothetical protein